MSKLFVADYPHISLVTIPCPAREEPDQIHDIVSSIRADEASIYLLIAYALALQASSKSTASHAGDDANSSDYRSRGQDLVLRKLQDPMQASSNSNIQAVLILIALVSDFGDPSETFIHVNGLLDMVTQRGGVQQMQDHLLVMQLQTLRISRALHLTLGCVCESSFRFSLQEQEHLGFDDQQ